MLLVMVAARATPLAAVSMMVLSNDKNQCCIISWYTKPVLSPKNNLSWLQFWQLELLTLTSLRIPELCTVWSPETVKSYITPFKSSWKLLIAGPSELIMDYFQFQCCSLPCQHTLGYQMENRAPKIQIPMVNLDPNNERQNFHLLLYKNC